MDIFGVHLNRLIYSDFFKEITLFKKQKIVFTPNPEILLKTKKDKNFKNILNKANYLIPDGTGIYIAYQIKNTNLLYKRVGNIHLILRAIFNFFLIPYYVFNIFFRKKYLYKKYGDKICGSDLSLDLVEFASENNIKITIIDLYNPGDKKKTKSQEIFIQKITYKFPKLDFDYFIYDIENKEKITYDISKSDSKILFSTLGSKIQEQSVLEIMDKSKNIKLGLAVGSSFDYMIGFQKRAPKFFRFFGLEWFYRIFTGPQKIKRLNRVYNAIFVFIWMVLRD